MIAIRLIKLYFYEKVAVRVFRKIQTIVSLLFFACIAIPVSAQIPVVSVSSNPSGLICTNTLINLSGNATNSPITSWKWTLNPSTGFSFTQPDSNQNSQINFSTQGTYTITLSATNASGTGAANLVVNVNPSASANFSNSFGNTGMPVTVYFNNLSSNFSGSIWSFGDGSPSITINSPSHGYAQTGIYAVQLIATNPNGCHDTIQRTIMVSDSSGISMPNIFTPNGDGINDVFLPQSTGLSKLDMRIYNRHGVLVSHIEKVNQHWDGRTTSGMECSEGTYYFVLRASGLDGKTYDLKGFVHLVR